MTLNLSKVRRRPSPLAELPVPAAASPGLSLELTKHIDGFRLEVSLTCARGQVLCLVGPSGSGKTTLMRMIAGLSRPDTGSISFGGRMWENTEQGLHLPPRRRGAGLVFQDYPLFPHLTLGQNVAFAAEEPGLVTALLERFGIGHLAGRRPGEVSGGERQRAAICQALARRPRVLLLDEPFSALDLDSRVQARRCFLEMAREQGLCVILVSHDLWDAAAGGVRSAALVHGRLDRQWLDTRLDLLRREAAGMLAGPERIVDMISMPPEDNQPRRAEAAT